MRHNTFILFFFLTASVLFARENRSKVGIRPWPRDSVHEMTGGGRVDHWEPGIGNYDAMLKADDYTAMHIDVVLGTMVSLKPISVSLSIISTSREGFGWIPTRIQTLIRI